MGSPGSYAVRLTPPDREDRATSQREQNPSRSSIPPVLNAGGESEPENKPQQGA